jgi:hypothetical protein
MCGLFEWKRICDDSFIVFTFCVAVEDPIIKGGGRDLDHIKRFKPVTLPFLFPIPDLQIEHCSMYY